MIKINKYLSASYFYLVGNMFNSGMAFLTVPIFTRLLSTSDYGIMNTYTSWVGIMTIIIGLNFPMGIRAAFSDYREDMNNFISSITTLSIIIAAVYAILILSLCSLNKYNCFLILLCLIQSFFMGILQNYSMYLMMKIEYKKRTFLMIVPNLLINFLSIIMIIYIINENLYIGKILVSVIVNTILGLIVIKKIYKKGHVYISVIYWKYILLISVPLVLHALSLIILSQVDRIMLSSISGPSQAGIYSLIYNYSMLASVVIYSANSVWIPWFTKRMDAKEYEKINKYCSKYIVLISTVIFVIIFISPEVLVLMAPKEYWSGKYIVPLIVLSSYLIFMHTIYVNVEHYYKKTKMIALNTLISAVLNIVLNLILIPIYGIYAAACTTLLSYFTSLVLHYFTAKSINNKIVPIKQMYCPLLVLAIMVTLYYLFIENIILRWVFVIIIMALMILYLWRYKKNLVSEKTINT